ncbi:MAG: hypothetical protein K1X78_10565, partial [Verrucomicrobiaceae bacterium]|nr:hypothetical protein [Verrucomicrobiaceae bacterium]
MEFNAVLQDGKREVAEKIIEPEPRKDEPKETKGGKEEGERASFFTFRFFRFFRPSHATRAHGGVQVEFNAVLQDGKREVAEKIIEPEPR